MNDPVSVIARQLETYNAKDIDGFMALWADDAIAHRFPDEVIARGAPEIRAIYAARFAEPDLHATLRNRAVVGNLVVDHERVRRTFPQGPVEVDVFAMYEVIDGKIARSWLKMGDPEPVTG